MMHSHTHNVEEASTLEHLRSAHRLDGWDVALRLSNGYSVEEIHDAEHAQEGR